MHTKPFSLPLLKWREASLSDIPALTDLVNKAYRGESGRKGWTTESDLLSGQRIDPQILSAILANSENSILVAESSGRWVGCVHVAKATSTLAYLGMLTVDPEFQTGGIGSFLINTAENFVKTKFGVERIEMTVIAQRSDLIRWYERREYILTGETRPFPYGDERFGIPLRTDLFFKVLEKHLDRASRMS